jgi:hypothetical protein
MPNSADRPFDDDTLKLRAVFVPENAKQQPSRAEIVSALGHDAVKVAAVFVPEGGKPPGYPYERFGRAQFRPDDDLPQNRIYTSQPTSSQPADAAQDNDGPVQTLPRTRFRFGAGLYGDPPQPPNQAAAGQGDPFARGTAAWRSMANPAAVLRQRLAVPAATQGEQGGISTAAAASGADSAAPAGQPAIPVRTNDGTAKGNVEEARVQAFLRLIRSAGGCIRH